MRNTLTLARREIASYFLSPMAYVIGALFLLASGVWFFWRIFIPGEEATLTPLFVAIAKLMVFATPLLTMRLLSDEYRAGTIEGLLTAPVGEGQVILGKFLGSLVFYLALLATTTIHLGLLAWFGSPDAGVLLMGYLGLLLLGTAFLSVGIFASTLTRYQLVAALVGIAILGTFTFAMPELAVRLHSPFNSAAAAMNAMSYFEDFARGILDVRGVVFLLSSTVLFLFVSTKMLESRRWR